MSTPRPVGQNRCQAQLVMNVIGHVECMANDLHEVFDGPLAGGVGYRVCMCLHPGDGG
jgi:hypothetical protein